MKSCIIIVSGMKDYAHVTSVTLATVGETN